MTRFPLNLPCAIGLAALGVVAAPAARAQDDGREALIGTYASAPQAQPAPGGGTAWVTGRFTFDGTRNTVTVAAFADEALTVPLFTYTSDGTVDVEGRSDAFDRAWNVISRNETSTVEVFVDAPDLWAGLGLGACPLSVGEAVEISDCVAGGPFHIAGCAEFDVLWLSHDRSAFRTGGGETDRCVERPTELGAIDFRRVNG